MRLSGFSLIDFRSEQIILNNKTNLKSLDRRKFQSGSDGGFFRDLHSSINAKIHDLNPAPPPAIPLNTIAVLAVTVRPGASITVMNEDALPL